MTPSPALHGPGRASILDGNSFRATDGTVLDPRTSRLVARRSARLGPSYRLFYRDPVEIVRGQGSRVWDASGDEYLDLYNNVPSVGHAHPAIVEAVHRQMATLTTHTRYLHQGILDFSDELVATLDDDDLQVVLVCTGSEANDLALRMGRAVTGGRAWIATREAYHGNTALVSAHSPSLAGFGQLDPTLRIIDPPDTYRAGSPEAAGEAFLAELGRAIAEIEASGDGLAGLIADFSFSSDGIFFGEPGMIAGAADLIHAHGGIVVADEVQPGFARNGDRFWGFQRHGIDADIVTTGKPMGNGYPVAAVIARPDVWDAFHAQGPYFNTFGGNPVAVAAAHAVLRTIESEGLQAHALETGRQFRSALSALAAEHDQIGDVRGAGLYIGVELVTDAASRSPDGEFALTVVEALRRRRVLTSVCGPHNNVLKLRPPLAFSPGDIPHAVERLALALADARATR
ncbi:aspartate aminotransferase family protein [Microbacterium sp. E-13]|uniref:aspartate aminotransferase family protein n=1 Tax=Microbacterium sp. E-13 TaxID=3404048 RepID=UPI003CF44F1C